MNDPNSETNNDRKFAWKRPTLSEVKSFIRVLDVDVFVLLFCFSAGVMNVTATQLVQDKICLNDLKLPPKVCENIQERKDYLKQASYIYKLTTKFSTYASLVIFIPGIFVTLLLGRWLDRYPQYTKYALIAPAIGNIIHVTATIYLTLNFETDYMNLLYCKIPFGLAGGLGLFFSTTFTHLTRRTSPKYRPMRYGMLDFSMRIGFAVSMSFGGSILVSKPWLAGQLRNYIGVFFASGLISLVSGLWIFFLIDDGPKPDEKNSENSGKFQTDGTIGPKKGQNYQTASDLFDFNNILAMIRTCFKKREENKHTRLWHVMACLTLALICSLGEMTITFQFVQRVFAWDAEYFSNFKTLTALIPAIGGVILPVILVNKFHLDDHVTGIIGSISIILAASLKGGILEPSGYFLGEALAVSTSLSSISFRSIMSKLIEPEEIGQIFTIFSAVQSLAPIISSAFYTFVFNKTLEVYPGFVYHLVGIVSFYPLIVMMWMNLSSKKSNTHRKLVKELKVVFVAREKEESNRKQVSNGESLDSSIVKIDYDGKNLSLSGREMEKENDPITTRLPSINLPNSSIATTAEVAQPPQMMMNNIG